MIEREKGARVGRDENLTPELLTGDRPLVERWARDLLPIFDIRRKLTSQLTTGVIQQDDDIAKFENGIVVPSFLVSIMLRWAREGPVILGSYCHPEEFDLYKIVGQLNLLQLLGRIKARGLKVPKSVIVENWYETIALDRTVTAPLNFGESFPIKEDILGLGSNRVGFGLLDVKQQLQVLETMNPEGVAKRICERLTNELEEVLLKTTGLTRRERLEKKGTIRDLVTQRISLVINLAESVARGFSFKRNPTVNDFLIEFQQRFGGLIIGGTNRFGLFSKLSQITGIEGTLSSENEKYISLVLDTLEELVDVCGASVLRKLINSTGEGLFLKADNDKEMILTVDNESGDFVVMNKKTWETTECVADPKIIRFIRNNSFMPLAKAETLVLVAGGMTFHMGSEHGSRERALFALGLNNERFKLFRDYLFGLRIGQDLQQGNSLFLLNGTRPIPAILAFVLFGENFLRKKLVSQAGAESRPESLSEKELKKLAAEKLVESV